jgi:hypothetical protein
MKINDLGFYQDLLSSIFHYVFRESIFLKGGLSSACRIFLLATPD